MKRLLHLHRNCARAPVRRRFTDTTPVDLVLVAESLGSKILFDAVRRLRERVRGLQERKTIDEAAAMGLEKALGRTQALYLISNQVPLLDLAACPTKTDDEKCIPGPHPSSLADFLTTLEAAPNDPPAKFEIIAFTDLNDLLSYRLLPEELRLPSTAVRLVNVIVSNAPTLLGVVERPDHAHMGCRTNPDVAQLLIRGNHPDTTD